MKTYQKTIYIILFLSWTIRSLHANPIHTRIPCDSAGIEGLFLRIDLPQTQRYPEGAPIVIYGPGGFKGAGEKERETGLADEGFIEIRLNFPGHGLPGHESGGTYDNRGQASLVAIRDIFQFIHGHMNSLSGDSFHDLIRPIASLNTNIGMIGWSNGGNTIICAAGMYENELSGLAWLIGWESPVGDGMPQAECGAKSEGILRPFNSETNNAYHVTSGTWDLSTLKYDSQIRIPRLEDTNDYVTGGFYFDFDGNNLVDPGKDFIPYPLVFEEPAGHQSYYSERIRSYVDSTGIDNNAPSHIPSLEKTQDFWSIRNGEYWIDSTIIKHPDLMYMIVASDTDHVQSSQDHPHVLNQYNRFINAGARFVRLNPDRIYVEEIIGTSMPGAVDNDAFESFSWQNIKSGVEPGNSRKNAFNKVHVAAAGVCEMADRTYYNNTDVQINHILTGVEPIITKNPDRFQISPNYPNPFNHQTSMMIQTPYNSEVHISIFDIAGRRINQQNLSIIQGKTIWQWHANDIPSGVYLIRVSGEGILRTKKVELVK